MITKKYSFDELGIDLSNTDLDDEQKYIFKNLINDFADVFGKDISDIKEQCLFPDLSLPLRPDSIPARQHPYRVSFDAQKEIDRQLDVLEANDIVEPSLSQWASPVVLVKNHNGNYRLACDNR